MEVFLFRIIPKGVISRIFGYITLIPIPKFLLERIISWYCGKYGVKYDEALVPEGGFRNLNHFFTRELKPGARKIPKGKKTIVSSTDSRVDQHGKIKGDTIMQAKGLGYSLRELVPSEMAERFLGGEFMTLYLSPGDYHRIHSPVSGRIRGFFHVPGKLYTVQESLVGKLKGLFAINERLITYIETDYGMVAVCKIGAINVGKISLAYDRVVTNRWFRRKREKLYSSEEVKEVRAGDEIGTFNLGSTVILLFEKGSVNLEKFKYGTKVLMGEKIGTFK